MKLKMLTCIVLAALPVSVFAQNLQTITNNNGNTTTNALVVTGSEQLPTQGKGLVSGYNPVGNWSFINSQDFSSSTPIPLNINNKLFLTNNGFIGINTATPRSPLDIAGELKVAGNATVEGALVSSVYGSWIDANGVKQSVNLGGALHLIDPSKDKPGEGREWVLYNMSGGYGNSLQFWNYDINQCNGALCQARLVLTDNGNIGIGTARPTSLLAVKGEILANKVRVTTNIAYWPDYVFADNYQLPSLNEVEKFINNNKHLPDVPSAATIEEKGLDLGDMQKLQMQKIEELTLYIIQQNKRIEALEAKIQDLQKK